MESNNFRILVIVAHADDIEFGVAGSVARWIREGANVTYCIVTDNGAGSNELGIQRDWLRDKRQQEQISAADYLGVKDVRFLGYRDGELEASLALRYDLARLIHEIYPQRVVCQDPTTVIYDPSYINHPDHRAAGAAALDAISSNSTYQIEEVYITFSLYPDTYIDISETMEQKIQALLYHESQVGVEDAIWIKAYNAEVGAQAGCQFAESYRVIRRRQQEREPGI